MRVLIAAEHFSASSEPPVLEQAAALLARGLDVHVLARKPTSTTSVRALSVTHRLAGRTSFSDDHPILDQGIVLALARLARAGEFRPIGAAIRQAVRRRLGHPLSAEAQALVRTAVTIRGLAPFDAVLAYGAATGDLILRARHALAAPWPVATVVHETELPRLTGGYASEFRRPLLSEGELFLPASDFVRAHLVTLGVDPGRAPVQRPGVEASPPQSTLRDDELVRFAAPGDLVERSGQANLIRAIAKAVMSMGERWAGHLTVIGEGPLEADLRGLAASLGVAARVAFAPAEAVSGLARFDVLAWAPVSLSDGLVESSHTSLTRAMSLGLPVISSRHGAIPEVVSDEETGLLVEEHDVGALARAMIRLSGDTALRRRMGEAGRQRVAHELSAERWADILAHRLRALAGGLPVS